MAGRPHRYHLSILGRKYILKWWRQTFRVESRRHPSCDEIFILLFLLFDYTHGFVCRALSQIFSAAFVLRRNQRPTMALSYFLGVAFCRRAIYWVSSSKCLFVLCRVCFRVSCEFRSHTHTRRDRVLPFRPPDLYLPIFSSQVSEAAKKTHINNYESPSSIFFFLLLPVPLRRIRHWSPALSSTSQLILQPSAKDEDLHDAMSFILSVLFIFLYSSCSFSRPWETTQSLLISPYSVVSHCADAASKLGWVGGSPTCPTASTAKNLAHYTPQGLKPKGGGDRKCDDFFFFFFFRYLLAAL